jgi:hypothetical protein
MNKTSHHINAYYNVDKDDDDDEKEEKEKEK